jgi:hypothetical protein
MNRRGLTAVSDGPDSAGLAGSQRTNDTLFDSSVTPAFAQDRVLRRPTLAGMTGAARWKTVSMISAL